MSILPLLPGFGDNPFGSSSVSATPHKKMKIDAFAKGKKTKDIAFDMNPTTFKLDRSVEWTDAGYMFGVVSELKFKSAKSDTLTFQVLLDATETGGSIAQKAAVLYDMTRPGDSTVEETKRPPLCQLTFGEFLFTGVISSLSIDYIMFSEDGLPIRGVVDISLMGIAHQHLAEADFFKARV